VLLYGNSAVSDTDSYRCPAGETMTMRFSSLEHWLTLYG